jgi:hypothetical protein
MRFGASFREKVHSVHQKTTKRVHRRGFRAASASAGSAPALLYTV